MAKNVLVDASFLIALLSRAETNHGWAAAQVPHLPRTWVTCEAVLSEAFYLLAGHGDRQLAELLRRGVVTPAFDLGDELESVLTLMTKYSNVPMGLADGALLIKSHWRRSVRMEAQHETCYAKPVTACSCEVRPLNSP